MSKRFGRNQKRRMREALLASEGLRKAGLQTISAMRSRLEDHQRFLEYVLEIVGEESILNPEPPADRVQKYNFPKIVFQSFPRFCPDEGTVACVQNVIANALETRVVLDRLKGAIHFRARLGNGDVVYALSDRAIAVMTTRQLAARLQQEISYQLANELAKELKR